MDTSRFLIVGAYGQLGKALQAKYPDAIAADRDTFDMTDQKMLRSYDWSKIDTILNAAAFTNVDGAETSEGRKAAWEINAHAIGSLAIIAAEHNLTLVHISSDYVFDGSKAPHSEEEAFTPLNMYGKTKAAGDIAATIAPKHYILRTSWVIGDGPNFVRAMIDRAGKNISPTVVADQVGRLTFVGTLVDAIDHLLRNKPGYGTYNVSNDGEPASWAAITRTIFKELGHDDLAVTDTTTAEYFVTRPAAAPRPLKSVLDLNKIKATGLQLRDWRDDLHDYIKAETAKPKEQES